MKMLKDVREVIKSLKHGKPAKIYCPRCCSPKINLSSELDIWLTPKKYVCENCGYKGPIVMEIDIKKEEEAID
jgi:predicted RNA-binding Zn-ribbon protein involved in translation (DUF1610 family)